jgi:hypothetical protein
MRKLLLSIVAMMCCFNASAQGNPSIILKTAVENKPLMLRFATSVDVDNLMIDWGDGKMETAPTIAADDGWQTTTPVYGFPVGTGEVKIYCDKITVFDCGFSKSIPMPSGEIEGAKVTELNVSNLPTLQYLYAPTNELTQIDLTKNIELLSLELSNNMLENIDLSSNAKLTKLTLTNNKFSSIDLSKNAELVTIYLSENPIKVVDFTANNKLKNIYALKCGLTDVKFGNNNTERMLVSLNFNELSTLDVSTLTGLESLQVNNNQLTEVKFSEEFIASTSKSKTFNVMNNRFTLATLPVPGTITRFNYAPQQPMEVAKSYAQKEVLDLSAQNNIKGILDATVNTVYTLKTTNGDELTEGTDYTITDGKITFLTTQDAVYVSMTTEAFPKFSSLKAFNTTPFAITVAQGIKTVGEEHVTIAANNGMLCVKGMNGATVTVYDVTGKTVATLKVNGNETSARLPHGLYLVKAGDKTVKVTL